VSSSIGHSILAAVVAIPTNEATLPVKVAVVTGLVLSHGLLDAIPHHHFYSFAGLKVNFAKNALGAVVELGGGLLVLPYLFWHFTGVDPLWLATCVFAASLFDFLVATGNQLFDKLNHWFHWWEKGESCTMVNIFCEIATITLICAVANSLKY